MSPGERLPGIREYALSQKISIVTARNVYQYLAQQGLIVLRQGAGSYVARGAVGGVIDLSAVRPAEEGLLWIGAHLRLSQEGLLTYDPPQGYAPLLAQAGAWLASLGIEGRPLVTAGSQQALFLAGLALLRPRDRVAVEDPGYRGARRIFEALGAQVLTVPYLAGAAELEQLRGQGIRLFYTMPQGHVPSGAFIPDGLRPALLELAGQEDFLIIEDDPHSELIGQRPLKAADRRGRVIYIKSLSSLLGPGLRIGFAVVPESLYARILDLKEINDLSLSGLLQRAVCSMFASGDLKAHIERLRGELRQRRTCLAQNTPWQTDGPCLWLPTPAPSRTHHEQLLRRGVRITPGDIYGPQWSTHIRISLLSASRPDFERGIAVVADYLAQGSGPSLTEF